jgi:RsiW-degrading membrane proteinase PrsW (M82 family)
LQNLKNFAIIYIENEEEMIKMFFVHVLIFVLAFIVLEYSLSNCKEKRTLPERLLDISMFLLAAVIMGFSAEGAIENIKL